MMPSIRFSTSIQPACARQRNRSSWFSSPIRDDSLTTRSVLAVPPFNFILHTSPLHEQAGDFYHWHIEIIPKLTQIAGFEWGTGFYINPVLPEEAAVFLRNVEI